MADKNEKVTCTVEFTEGALERITEALMDIYYSIEAGLSRDPRQKDKTA